MSGLVFLLVVSLFIGSFVRALVGVFVFAIDIGTCRQATLVLHELLEQFGVLNSAQIYFIE